MREDKPEWLERAERAFLDERRDEAEALTRSALAKAEAANDTPATIRALEYLTFLVMANLNRQDEYHSLGKRVAALREAYANEQVQKLESELSPDHPDLIGPLMQLADVFRIRLYEARHELPDDVRDLDDYFGRALSLHDRADAICRAAFGDASEEYARQLMARARLFEFHAGSPSEAVDLLRRAVQLFENSDPASVNAQMARFALAGALRDSGEFDEAAGIFEEMIAEDPDGRAINPIRSLLASVYQRLGRQEESLALQREVEANDELSLAEKPYLKSVHAYNLAGDLVSARKFGEAERQYRKALELSALSPHESLMMRGIMQRELADCLCQLKRAPEAVAIAKLSLASVEAELGPDHYHTAASLMTLCFSLNSEGDQASVRAPLERAAEIMCSLPVSQLARDEGLARACVDLLEACELGEMAARIRRRVRSIPDEWQPPEP